MSKSKSTGYLCECGGKLRPARLASFDFSTLAGLPFPVRLQGVPGLRCSRCRGETLEGTVINRALRLVALALLELPARLPSEVARYLRSSLGLTQAELATRMDVNRVTIAKWESGEDAISSAHDMVLRALAFGHLAAQLGAGAEAAAHSPRIFDGVRTAKPAASAKVPPIILRDRSGAGRRSIWTDDGARAA